MTWDLKWSDFFQLHFPHSNQTLLEEYSEDFITAQDITAMNGGRDPRIHIISTSHKKSWRNFHSLEKFTKMQIENQTQQHSSSSLSHEDYFIWEISSFFFNMDLFLKENSENVTNPDDFPSLMVFGGERDGKCGYTHRDQLEPSDLVVTAANAMWDTFPASRVGVLHLRRGDSVEGCDTSIDRMKTYLECSFENSTNLGNFTILLGTDEKDESYIQSILALLDEFPHIQMQWLDEAIERHVENMIAKDETLSRLRNNFFTYAILKEIGKRADFVMEHRRDLSCPDCSPVREFISEKG